MKKLFVAGSVAALLSVAAIAVAQPWQGWKGCGGCCNESGGYGGYGRTFDKAKVETMKGEVASVEQIAGRRMGQGIGITLNTGSEKVFVHIGPQWYVERQGEVKIAAGDTVEVKGVKTARFGQDVVIATEVKKGGDVLKLRDDDGVPLWAGWRRGRIN